MSTIRVASTGTVEERLIRVEKALNYEEELHCAQAGDPPFITNPASGPYYMLRWSIPMKLIRHLMPEDRWALYAAGFATCAGAFTLTFSYTDNASTPIVLATYNFSAMGWTKLAIGPVAARGDLAPTVPLEDVAVYGMAVSVADSAQAVALTAWTYWMRMTPRRT